MYICIRSVFNIQHAEKFRKQPAKLALRKYLCICTHLRSAGKIVQNDLYSGFHCLLAIK